MPSYDPAHYNPPAPIAMVSLRPVGASAPAVECLLLLDTGADITLLPRAAIEHLGVRPLAGIDYELIGFDGSRRTAQSVDLDMVFLRKTFRGRYILVDGDERGVLGRDVLAELALVLDGPAQEWSER